jgi:hypothetical protein
MTPDDYEADGTAGEASDHVLGLGTAEWHNLAPIGDRDVVLIDLAAGHQYSIATSDLSGGADTALTVLAPGGAPVASNDDVAPGNPASAVGLVAQETGRYAVVVDDPRLHGGGYILTAAEVQVTPLPPVATSLSIRWRRSRPRVRHSFVLAGTLSPAAAGRVLRLSVLRPRTHHWVQVGSVRTSSRGAWSKRYWPTRRGIYRLRVRFAGNAAYSGSVSRTFSIRIR